MCVQCGTRCLNIKKELQKFVNAKPTPQASLSTWTEKKEKPTERRLGEKKARQNVVTWEAAEISRGCGHC